MPDLYASGSGSKYFPNKHVFDAITGEDIKRIMQKLNNRPEKCLGFKSATL
jgi:IS30 family transposase